MQAINQFYSIILIFNRMCMIFALLHSNWFNCPSVHLYHFYFSICHCDVLPDKNLCSFEVSVLFFKRIRPLLHLPLQAICCINHNETALSSKHLSVYFLPRNVIFATWCGFCICHFKDCWFLWQPPIEETSWLHLCFMIFCPPFFVLVQCYTPKFFLSVYFSA